MIFEKRRLVKGQKMTPMEIEKLIDAAVNNVILSGFENEEQLDNLLFKNSEGDVYLTIRMLNNLIGIYSDNLVKEGQKYLEDRLSAPNIGNLTTKINLISDCYDSIVARTGRSERITRVQTKSERKADEVIDEDYVLTSEEEQLLADTSETSKISTEVSKIVSDLFEAVEKDKEAAKKSTEQKPAHVKKVMNKATVAEIIDRR